MGVDTLMGHLSAREAGRVCTLGDLLATIVGDLVETSATQCNGVLGILCCHTCTIPRAQGDRCTVKDEVNHKFGFCVNREVNWPDGCPIKR